MALFNLEKKNGKTKEPTCACNSNVKEVKTENSCKDCGCAGANERIQSIKILGVGCKACHEQFENTKKQLRI